MTHRASMRASRGLPVLAALSMIASAPGAATDPSQGLTEHVFLNSGVVRSNETFEMVAIGRRGGIADGSCMETYAYRQVMSNRNMATQDYTAGGAYQYLYRVERNSSSGGASPPTGLAGADSREQQQPPPLCAGCNALGHDFKLLEYVKTLAACVEACVAAGAECCQSFTWSPANKVPGGQGCYLKSTVGPAMQCSRPKAEVSGCSPLLASRGPLPPGCNCTAGPVSQGPTDHRPAPPQCHLPPSSPPWPPPPPGRHTTPASGMRSALPLGTFGQTVELRADGTLADWRGIFNNGPEGGRDSESGITVPAAKVDIDDAVFAVFVNRTDRPGDAGTRFLVRTHPPRASNLSTREGVAALEYSGSFPVARLRVLDDALPVSQVKITATSPFFPEHSNADWMSNQSSSSVAFVLTMTNPPTASGTVNVSAMFNLPDVFNASVFRSSAGHATIANTAGSGMTVAMNMRSASSQKSRLVTAVVGKTLTSNFNSFADHGGTFVHPEGKGESSMAIDPFQHLAVAIGPVTLAPGENTIIDIVLAWSFPQHRWHTCKTAQGNFGQVKGGSVATAEITLATVQQREAQALAWHELCTATDLPVWLQDALINTPAALYKTSMWTREGKWRMWESHSCADLQPGHLHFYHAQLLNTLFPSIDRQLVEFYADSQFPSGQVSNSFGRPNIACNFDVPDQDPGNDPSSWQNTGLARLDTVAVFILDNLLNFQTHADGKTFMQGKQYHAVTKAVGNMMASSADIGLPRRRYNTFDGGLQGETNTYNSFLYIVSLAAGVRLANATGDSAHAREWQAALVRGVKAIDNHLWLDNAGYYQGVYCMQDPANGQLYGDSLYGLSWAVTLHLVPQLEAAGLRIDRVQSHLRVERKINLTPYGLRFSSPLPPNTTFSCPSIPTPSRRQNGFYAEDDIWPAASASWTTLAIALNVTSSADDAFEVLESMVTAYRDQIHDQWDFRDLGTATATGVGPSPDEKVPFRPVCNSHYGRQLNIWQAVAAWSGLRFDAHWTSPGVDTTNAGGSKGLLALAPHPSAHQFPVLLPTGNGVVTLTADGQRIERIRWLSGELDVAAITLHDSVLASEVRLRAGQLWPGSV